MGAKSNGDFSAVVQIVLHQMPDDPLAGVTLQLGRDLDVDFPESLQEIGNLELSGLLDRYDPTPDSHLGSGALAWADLPDRLHFIIDLFRCYQENRELLESPFTPEQVKALKAGRLPAGRL